MVAKNGPQFQCVKWVNVSFSSSHGRLYSSEVDLDSFLGFSLLSSISHSFREALLMVEDWKL